MLVPNFPSITINVWATPINRDETSSSIYPVLSPLCTALPPWLPTRRRRAIADGRAGLRSQRPLVSLHGIGGVSGFWETPSRLLAAILLVYIFGWSPLHRRIRLYVNRRRSASPWVVVPFSFHFVLFCTFVPVNLLVRDQVIGSSRMDYMLLIICVIFMYLFSS
jgi:hypothetical protein